jgi:acyl carrier protein
MADRSVENVANLVKHELGEVIEREPNTIAPDADLRDALCLESLQQLELMHRLEEILRVSFDAEAWLEPTTVGELAEHITGKLVVAGGNA